MHSVGCHLANFNEEQLSNYQAVRSRKYFRIKNLSHAKVSIVWLQLSWWIITLVADPYYVFDWILSWYSVMIYILLITAHLSPLFLENNISFHSLLYLSLSKNSVELVLLVGNKYRNLVLLSALVFSFVFVLTNSFQSNQDLHHCCFCSVTTPAWTLVAGSFILSKTKWTKTTLPLFKRKNDILLLNHINNASIK